MRIRRSFAVLAMAFSLGACGDDAFQVIEQTEFAASLGINLGSMTRLESGVYIQDLVVGTGLQVEPGATVSVAYRGYISDGTLFDSRDASNPFTFLAGANQVILGFDLGIDRATVGSTRLILIPPDLGYGDRQAGIIPPGSILIFEVDILDVTPPA